MKLVTTHKVGARSHLDALSVRPCYTVARPAVACWATDKLRPTHVERHAVGFELLVQAAHVHPKSYWRTEATEVLLAVSAKTSFKQYSHDESRRAYGSRSEGPPHHSARETAVFIDSPTFFHYTVQHWV